MRFCGARWTVKTVVGVCGAVVVSFVVWCAAADSQETSKAVGIFEWHGDVGKVEHAGSTEFDAKTSTYAITGSGENMWFGKDAFQFAWKKVDGPIVY